MFQEYTHDFLSDIQNRINLQKCQYDCDETTSDSGDDVSDEACGFCQGCIEGVKETGAPLCDDFQ